MERALARDRGQIKHIFSCLRETPMFAGSGSQVKGLAKERNKVRGKVKAAPYEMAELASVRIVALWDEESQV